MTREKRSPRSPRRSSAYHHGTLREAAIEAAAQIVGDAGHEAVSMREVAETLGVTPMALYRHFENRTALLSAIAARGQKKLYERHQQASLAHEDLRQQLEASLRAFLDFVGEHPRLFILIYSPEIARATDNASEGPEAPAYRSIGELLRKAAPSASAREIRLREIAMWSALYGYSMIRTHGLLKGYMVEGLSEEEIVAAVIQTALGSNA